MPADSLDSRSQPRPSLTFQVRGRRIRITCRLAEDTAKARKIFARRKKFRLLEELLDCKVEVTLQSSRHLNWWPEQFEDSDRLAGLKWIGFPDFREFPPAFFDPRHKHFPRLSAWFAQNNSTTIGKMLAPEGFEKFPLFAFI